jgi:DNA-binding response OmpR family regulator
MCAAYAEVPKRVLIIDDDIDLLMLLERRLLKEGFAVESAASLPEAEEIMSFFEPQVVVLDLNVNGEGGRRLGWKLKKGDHPYPVKVIMMSGYDCNLSRAALFGADDMLAKPLHTEFLVHRINELVPAQERSSGSSFSEMRAEHEE